LKEKHEEQNQDDIKKISKLIGSQAEAMKSWQMPKLP
jgi:hypothetical protein